MNLPNIYENKQYKKLIAIPLLLVVIALFFIPSIPRGVDLKGGSLFTILSDESVQNLPDKQLELEERLGKFSNDVSVRIFENPSGRGFEIEVGTNERLENAQDALPGLKEIDRALASEVLTLNYLESNEPDLVKIGEQRKKVEEKEAEFIEEANSILEEMGSSARLTEAANGLQVVEDEFRALTSENRDRIIAEIREVIPVKSYTAKEVGSSLSKFFLSKTAEILLISLIAVGILVVLIFRGTVATIAVLFGALADIIITAGAMGLFGIPLSLATVAALLMLIGFSIDTDMLLTIRVLKRSEGNAKERAYEAMRTAFLMNSAAVSAFAVLVAVAMVLRIDTYFQIGAVAMIGGIIDFVATWAGNAVIILWYSEIKHGRE